MIFDYKVKDDTTLIEFLNSFYLSKSKIYTLFLEGLIKVNDKPYKREDKIRKGDIVSIDEKEEIDFIPDNTKIDIVYEDDFFLIVNKPQGIIIHPDDKSKTGTLCNRVAGYYKRMGYDITVKYAHRLDTDTTGIIIFCKDMLTMSYMNHYISTHDIARVYNCIVSGKLEKKADTLIYPIGEDRHVKGKRRVSKTGADAVTHYEVLNEFGKYSLVKVILETGRTHQIRVHFSHINHPLYGDKLYGGNMERINRVALHSYELKFMHPVTKESLDLVCELPSDMKKLIK